MFRGKLELLEYEREIMSFRLLVALMMAGIPSAGCRSNARDDVEPELVAHERVPPVPQRVLEPFRRDYPGVQVIEVQHQFTELGPIVYRFLFRDGALEGRAFYYYNGRRATPDLWRDGETAIRNALPQG